MASKEQKRGGRDSGPVTAPRTYHTVCLHTKDEGNVILWSPVYANTPDLVLPPDIAKMRDVTGMMQASTLRMADISSNEGPMFPHRGCVATSTGLGRARTLVVPVSDGITSSIRVATTVVMTGVRVGGGDPRISTPCPTPAST